MVPSGALLLGNPPTLAGGGGGDGYEKLVLIPLFLASAFLFFITYQLFGVAAAAGVMVLFVVLAAASHRVHVSREFPFLHVSLGPGSRGDSGCGDAAGMDTAAIAALPAAFGYKRHHAAATGWAQCAICLGLVRVGEAARRMPACGHLFHAGCIDKWLREHATCPLCRAAVSGAVVPELPAA